MKLTVKIFVVLALLFSNLPTSFYFSAGHLAPSHISYKGIKFSEKERAAGRDLVFPQINGIGLPPLISALSKFDGLSVLKELNEPATVSHISATLKQKGAGRVNEGHLRVGLNYFAANGWLDEIFISELDSQTKTVFYSITDAGKEAFTLLKNLIQNGKFELIEKFVLILEKTDITDFLFSTASPNISPDHTTVFEQLIKEVKTNWGLSEQSEEERLIADYLDGLIVGGVMTAFLEKKVFTLEKTRVSLDLLSGNKERLKLAMELLTHLGWVAGNGTWFQVKQEGAYPLSINSSNVVPYSYLKTFAAQKELIFGNPRPLLDMEQDGTEKHLNRARNILGSEQAHQTYFKKFDNLLKPIFHNQPLENQPAAFLDIGCGQGWVLEKVLEYIVKKTDRGKNLDLYPITLIGADVSPVSLQATEDRLNALRTKLGLSENQLKVATIHGDFNDVAGIKKSLKEMGVKPDKTLPYFGMVLHNRTYKESKKYKNIPFNKVPLSTGVFVGPDGEDINERNVVGNLAEVLEDYGSFPHGFISLELYAVATAEIKKRRRETLNLSYRHHHGHSRQILVEVPVEQAAAKLAGLEIKQQILFPRNIAEAQNALTHFVPKRKHEATTSPRRIAEAINTSI